MAGKSQKGSQKPLTWKGKGNSQRGSQKPVKWKGSK